MKRTRNRVTRNTAVLNDADSGGKHVSYLFELKNLQTPERPATKRPKISKSESKQAMGAFFCSPVEIVVRVVLATDEKDVGCYQPRYCFTYFS